MIGESISQYKILEKLGEGGMGVVYKALDTKLNREVALKFLPPHISKGGIERERFLQEAQAAAAINHPNICVIYEINDSGDQPYIAMEYVDGSTIRTKLESGPMRPEDAIKYGIQIGEALQEAHRKGIVHRDIKADNIIINSKGQAKVMDFGLAKLKGSLKLTRTSSTVGTLGYMAPEQIQGGEVDSRSDIFAFAVLFYEMLTARLPFRGEHEAAMVYSIVNEDPEPIQKYLPEVSPEIAHTLTKALEKDPENRYQNIQDMVVDLRRAKKDSTRVSRTQSIPEYSSQSVADSVPRSDRTKTFSPKNISIGIGILTIVILAGALFRDVFPTIGGGESKKVIVVLPFENLGPSDKDYFVDGMTDEITTRLSGLSGLSVIARTSAVQYQKTAKTPKQIGTELGVNYILQGTVRWETVNGNIHVRVNPSLVKVQDGTQMWSQSMESVLSTAFKLQSDIASRVAGAMDIALGKSEKKSLETSLTENSEAYDYYLQALDYSNRSASKTDAEIATRLLEKSIRIDPSFAAAYAVLARMHAMMYWFFYDRSEQRVELARAAAQKAVTLAPDLSESHEAMGWYFYHTKLDYKNALEEFSLALKYRSNNSMVHYGIGSVLRRQGDMRGSVNAYDKAIESNPRAADIIRQRGETLTLLREYQEAEVSYDRALELTPDISAIYYDKLKNTLLWTGDIASARRIQETGKRLGKVDELDFLLNYMSYYVEMLDGRYHVALAEVNNSGTKELLNSQFEYAPSNKLRADVEYARGNLSLAMRLYDSARIQIQQKLKSSPNDERAHSALGLVLARLGRKDEAIRAGMRGIELLPVEKEAWRGSFRMIDMAKIYTTLGEYDKAIELIDRLLSIPSEVSPAMLKLDHDWKPLQKNKRFQRMIAG